MRLLFTSTAGRGHLMPLLPIAEAAAAAGHEVTIASSSTDITPVVALGLPHLGFDRPTETERELARQALTGVPDAAEAVATDLAARLNPAAARPRLRAILADIRPNVVISEAAEFTGGLLAEVEGIPVVRVHPGLSGGGRFERLVAPILSRQRERLGLPADQQARWLLDTPQISYFPAAFEGNDADLCRVRTGHGVPEVSPGERSDTAYISFGTELVELPYFRRLARDTVAAARWAGLDVVLSIAYADPAQFADLAATGVKVERWVDQNRLLPTVRVAICHAGAGTTLSALAAGTPIVAVPFLADQPLNADRIVATGTGAVVPPGPDFARRLAATLCDVLAEEPPGCRPIAEAIRAMPDVTHAVDLITKVGSAREHVPSGDEGIARILDPVDQCR